jgi:hypothetical protein
MENIKPHCFLLATHFVNESILKMYWEIAKATDQYGDVFLLYHKNDSDKEINFVSDEIKKHIFSSDDLNDLGYTPIRESVIPGSNHFSLLHFYKQHLGYQHYWYVEYDVQYSGNWKTFFNFFKDSTYDFITCDIRKFGDSPSWTWWNSFEHPSLSFELDKQLRSFNPIYRMSYEGLKFIHKMLSNGWIGHHEVLLPTLLYNNKFKLLDFGGNGDFTDHNCVNRFYTSQTFRWRPIFLMPGSMKDKLYHPVKIDFSLSLPHID